MVERSLSTVRELTDDPEVVEEALALATSINGLNNMPEVVAAARKKIEASKTFYFGTPIAEVTS